jgi:hypothetical protein
MSFGSLGAAADMGWRQNKKGVGAVPPYTAVFNFVGSETLDPRITASGGANGTRVNSAGVIVGQAAPRYDHDPATLASRGVLIEEARTNSALRNAEFDNAIWVTTGASVTPNVINSPAGTLTMDKLVESATSGAHRINQNTALAPTTQSVFSVYAKAGERTRIVVEINDSVSSGLYAVFDLTNGVLLTSAAYGTASATVTAGIVPAGGGIYRCYVSGIAASSGTTTQAKINPSDASNSGNYPGDGISGIYIWGAQLEAGASFATSWIPVLDTPVTRSADTLQMSGTNFSSWFNPAAGTFDVNADTIGIGPAARYLFAVDDGTASNRYIGAIGTAGTDVRADAITAGISQGPLITGNTAAGAALGLSFAYAANDLAGSLNGGAAVTDTSASLPVVNALRLGMDSAGNQLCGHLKSFGYWSTRLTNAQLQQASSQGMPPIVPPPGIANISRPANLTLNSKWIGVGDSTTFGVGAVNDVSEWCALLRGTATSTIPVTWHGGGTNFTPRNTVGNSGVSGNTSTQLLGLAQTNLAPGANPGEAASMNAIWSLGINDYTLGDRAWTTTLKTNFATYSGLLTGQPMLSNGPIPEMGDQPASIYGSDIRYNQLDMRDTYGNRSSDLGRMLRHYRELAGGMAAGTANRIALDFEDVALDYRQDGATTAYTALTTDVAPQTGTALPALTFDEGTYFYNTTSGQWYRKRGANGAGSWSALEANPKHFVPNGYQAIARINADYMAAQNGTGPAQPLPDRFRVASDIASGAAVGTMRAMGTVTAWGIQSDYAGTFAAEVAIDAGGKITRTGTGSLTPGRKTYVVCARSALGVLSCPIDIYTGAASTVTIPPNRVIPSPGITVGSRMANGIADGTKLSMVFMITPNVASGQGYLVYAQAGARSIFNVLLNNSGFFRASLYDAGGTIIGSTPTISLSGVNVAGATPICIAMSVDIGAGLSSLYWTTSTGEVNHTASMPALTGLAAMTLSAGNWSFLSAGAAPSPLHALTNPYFGGFRRLWLVDDYIDFTVAANRRVLYDATGNALAAAPYAPIAGIAPKFDIWGGVGDLAWGLPPGVDYKTRPLALACGSPNITAIVT